MENQNQNTEVFGLQFDESSKNNLKTMATWAMIMVICSLTGIVLGFVSYFKTKNEVVRVFEEYDFGGSMRSAQKGNLVQLVISALVSLLLAYFLYQFSSRTKKGIEGISQPDLNSGLGNLKNYFMTTGIIAIIAIVFIVLAFLFVGSMM